MNYLVLIMVIFGVCAIPNAIGIKCFVCEKKVLPAEVDVKIEESDKNCDDFRKADDSERKQKYSVDCIAACEQTLIKGQLFMFGKKEVQMDIEQFGCHNPATDDKQINIVMGECVNIEESNETACVCNEKDYCLVDEKLSLDSGANTIFSVLATTILLAGIALF